MKDSSRNPNLIPKEQLTAYERWELPLLDASGNEVAREEERDVKPLTASDLAEIRQAAREDGVNEGREKGLREGRAEGYEQGHKEGFETGHAEGKALGQSAGYDETRAEVTASLDRLEPLLGELLLPIRQHQDELETSLLNLTTVLARAVVYRELTLDSSHIRQVVRRAVEALPSTADNVRIHVHPDDYSAVREVAERFEAAASVVEDDSMLPGGCKVETRNSLVDFTVEKRFQRAVQSMLEQQTDDAGNGESEELGAVMDDLTDFQRDVLSSPGETPNKDTPSETNPTEGKRDDILPG
ncbi:MAG TPA: flagellar assembly protein FliH [Marinobacter sp.]|uniref:Flagellar assembly protein FliH n=2 Tax=root TaxID=1 RepID=A0A831R0Q8_9GAMM|nr:flagellar assembly protein FliH [Marinobacter antarcticus]HDZ39149.1 flagellar assembly protein FliH [Marinobacter sp.]HEA52053.1 flagellar assembly protein FliH [Marinobacter antarcticus]